MRVNRCVAMAAMVAMMGSSAAVGQIAPPPPPAPPKTPEFVPPPPAPVAPAPTGTVMPPPAPPPDPIENIKYESLVQRDEAGKLLPLTESAEVAALKNNPLIPKEMWSSIEQVVQERTKRIERSVVENLDLAQKLDGGMIDELRILDVNKIKTIGDVAKTLTPPPLLTMIKERELLSTDQFRLTEKIHREYQSAYTKELAAKAEAESGGDKLAGALVATRFFLKDAVKESLEAYNRLLLTASGKAGGLGLDAEAVKNIAAAKTDAEKIAAVKAGMAKLPLEQQKAALKSLLN